MNKITIEHKYKVGDEVYYFDKVDFKIRKAEIINVFDIKIQEIDNIHIRYTIKYLRISGSHTVYEYNLYPSIEDVAKSLYEGD